ncbi:MAG: TIGR04100 family radical SAM protein [Lachnospiraceae bacterium]|nr:TIGR04100 family radical SAM protein [Lachnospiraceae bacterium]MDE6253605.1 TIGR04100 family radical SAM protein [Lachnospiraceae bacterium]
MTILYKVHDNIYVNLTNKCPCACTFCLRQTRDKMEDSDVLWLEHEPSVDEVKEAFGKINLDEYNQVVFCGFGEPTERLDVLLEVAGWLKENYNKKIRVNTNGLSDLIYGKDTAPMFEGKADIISISLNTPSRERYYELTRSKFGIESFDKMLEFAKNVKQYVKEVVLTTVETTLTKEEEEQCRKICESLGVTYRIRPWED